MSWYRTGTVTVTNGSTTVTGSGTAWVGNVIADSAIILPDGRAYEVAAIVSNTSLTLGSAYQGSNGSAQSYAILPTIGWARRVVDKVAEWQTNQQAYLDGPLSGRFSNGTAGAPSVSFLSDTDTGLFSKGANRIGFAVGGTEALEITAGGLLTSPTAITQSNTDATTGRLLKVGDFGVGLGRGINDNSDMNDVRQQGAISRDTGAAINNTPVGLTSLRGLVLRGHSPANENVTQLVFHRDQNRMWIRTRGWDGTWRAWDKVWTTENTTIDVNGFIKQASPVLRVFADHLESNDDASQQEIVYARTEVGVYTLSGSSGLATTGWRIEVPQDENGNRLVHITLTEDGGTITLETRAPEWVDGKLAGGERMDIPDGRWVDLRLNEIPAEP